MGHGDGHICGAEAVVDDPRVQPLLAICDQTEAGEEAAQCGAAMEMLELLEQAAGGIPPGETADQGTIHIDFGEQDSEDDVFGYRFHL